MKTLFIAVLLLAAPAFAQNDAASYCRYVEEQARAQADQLRTPSLVTGLSQPTAGTAVAVFSGVQNSIASDRKASLTLSLGRAQCAVYTSTESAQTRINYALPALQKEELQNRLNLIRQAKDELETLIQDGQRKVNARDLTRSALYTLQSAETRLESDRAATQAIIAVTVVPSPSQDGMRIMDLVQSKLSAESQMERTSSKQQSAQNWDVSLDAGVRRQLTMPQTDPYGEVIFTYNFGASAANRHLRRSEIAYGEWKGSQQGEVAQSANDLKKQLQDLIAAKQAGLAALLVREQVIDENLKTVDGVDSAAAITFRDQLQSDRLLLGIEIGDTTFSLNQIGSFLAANF